MNLGRHKYHQKGYHGANESGHHHSHGEKGSKGSHDHHGVKKSHHGNFGKHGISVR